MEMKKMSLHREDCERHDISRGRGIFLFWGAPIVIDVLVSVLQNVGWLSLTVAGILWTVATAWIGLSCVVNALRCSRVHCAIAGTLLLPLSVVGAFNVLGTISIGWDILGIYWGSFWTIVAIAFSIEFLWKPYYRC